MIHRNHASSIRVIINYTECNTALNTMHCLSTEYEKIQSGPTKLECF